MTETLPSSAVATPDERQVLSAVSRGSREFLTRRGQLTLVGRRWRDIFHALIADRGGREHLSEGQVQLARRCATLATKAEVMEDDFAQGKGELDTEAYCAITNGLGRALSRLGLKRLPKDITPHLEDYIEGRATEVGR